MPEMPKDGTSGDPVNLPPGMPVLPGRDAWDRAHWRWYDPDSGVGHYVIHNNLGGRQSRDFPPDSLRGAVNIAFFGDSQTQNLYMPAPYSFTEQLDYLLNSDAASAPADGAADRNPPRFNVLNFGHYNWGTGRAYLRWRRLPVRAELAHVFYLAYQNDVGDLRDAIRAELVRLEDSGAVLGGGRPRTPLWTRFLARWHLTYLGIDVWRRLAASLGQGAPGEELTTAGGTGSLEGARQVFRELLRRWRREVEAGGGVFHVVLFPDLPMGGFAEEADFLAEFNTLDLHRCFRAKVPDFDYRDWRFVKDPHWNPAANLVAATCLYRYLEDPLGLPDVTDEDLARLRYNYYQAFLESSAWEGERFAPAAVWARPDANVPPRDRPSGEAIVARYMALEVAQRSDRKWLQAVLAARAAGPVAQGFWDVYVNLRESLLVYVKTPCSTHWRPHTGARFLLHVIPFTTENLPAARAPYGFINLDGGPFSQVWRQDDECVFSVPLPDYPLSTVTTGQFEVRGEEEYHNVWTVRFQMPLARSVWEVRARAHGRGLEYVKAPCSRGDTEARFYLHVHPLRREDLPAGPWRRFANLDFGWGGGEADGECRISVSLPDYPIAFVDTGQFQGGLVSRRLWTARIDFNEVERARRRAGGGL